MTKAKTKKVKLSVNLKHPNKSFNLGAHKIGVQPVEYMLTEKEQIELDSPGAQKWIVTHGQKTKGAKASE